MGSTTSGQRTVSGRHQPGHSTKRLDPKANPRTRPEARSGRSREFAAFVEGVHRDLNPRGPLQHLVADHVAHAAWKLKANLERRSDPDPDAGTKPTRSRERATQIDHASRSIREALESLDYLKGLDRRAVDEPVFDSPVASDFDYDILSNEWPIVPDSGLDDIADPAESVEPEATTWHYRLVYDFNVSEASPVVKGTWVTASHVVSLIVDGWTWSDILRSYPELTEEDVRTCVAYAMAEESSAT